MAKRMNVRERLVYNVQRLERLEAAKARAAEDMKDAFAAARAEGFDQTTLKAVLKLRKMTPHQRTERRALEAIYLAALGMLEGDSLPEAARRRLDRQEPERKPAGPQKSDQADPPGELTDQAETPTDRAPHQPPLIQKDPADAFKEGAEAGAAGKRIYDNPYPAGDPCRAAWDEGWCSERKSHGMDTPEAFQRRTEKKPKKPKDGDGGDHEDDGGLLDDTGRGDEHHDGMGA